MHAKATINGNTIAETDHFEYVEGNVYFPPDSIIKSDEMGLTPSSHTTHCPWKGQSTYYDVHMNGATIQNAAWGYESPLPKAVNIKDHVAFDKGKVHVEKDNGGEGHGLKDKLKNMMKG